MRSCPACGHRSHSSVGTATVLGRHEAEFWCCGVCGSVYAPDPYWLDEAYESAIAATDIGLVERNIHLAGVIRRLCRFYFRDARSFLDFAGGNGMFVRIMRDAGYPFQYADKYGPNLFAVGFETVLPTPDPLDVATAFEVLEHLIEPRTELADLFAAAGTVVATTSPVSSPPPPLGTWPYYSLGTGQHISFYTHRGLDALAERFGRRRSSAGDVHVFAQRPLKPLVLRLLTSRRLGRHLNGIGWRPTLLETDYRALTGEELNTHGD